MKTLSALAETVRAGHSLEIGLGDFLDGFYRQPDAEAFREEPALLAGMHPDGALVNAFLAAVAEHLARGFALPIPDWVFAPSRYLEKPYFAVRGASFCATLLLESPMAFRSRNLFVTANALSRASEHASRLPVETSA
jgi:hypothetical protein